MNFTFWIRNRKMVIENPVKRVAMSIVDMLGFWLYKLLAFFGYKRAQNSSWIFFSEKNPRNTIRSYRRRVNIDLLFQSSQDKISKSTYLCFGRILGETGSGS